MVYRDYRVKFKAPQADYVEVHDFLAGKNAKKEAKREFEKLSKQIGETQLLTSRAGEHKYKLLEEVCKFQ
jgi:hypothetical protein